MLYLPYMGVRLGGISCAPIEYACVRGSIVRDRSSLTDDNDTTVPGHYYAWWVYND